MIDDNFDEGHDAGYEAGQIDAAAEIERLKAELREARELIKGLDEMIIGVGEILIRFSDEHGFDASLTDAFRVTPEEGSLFYRARAFLTKGETDNG